MGEQRSRPDGQQTASRRGFLVVTVGAVLAAGGGGVAAALRHADPRDPDSVGVAPGVLVAALQAEIRLIALIDALGAPADLAHLRADHVQHRDAVAAAMAQAAGGTVPTPVPSPATVPKLTLAQLLAAEQAAAGAAAAAADQLTGAHAVLLASISACESSHAELLR